MEKSQLLQILYSLPAVVIGLTLHELAHAYTALKLGDDTAKRMGRITLNPIKHIDPFGFFLIVVAGFGWAKPVQFNPENLKNPRRDQALIAASGPLTNLALSLSAIIFFKAVIFISGHQGINQHVNMFFIYFIFINMALFIFNALPIPPLDGSHILFKSLNLSVGVEAKLYRYGSFALLALILLDREFNILPIGELIMSIMRVLI